MLLSVWLLASFLAIMPICCSYCSAVRPPSCLYLSGYTRNTLTRQYRRPPQALRLPRAPAQSALRRERPDWRRVNALAAARRLTLQLQIAHHAASTWPSPAKTSLNDSPRAGSLAGFLPYNSPPSFNHLVYPSRTFLVRRGRFPLTIDQP